MSQLPKITCPNKNPARMVCGDLWCEKPGIFCFHDECNCREVHKDCSSFQVNRFMKILTVSENQINSYNLVETIVEGMINQLNQIKKDLDIARKTFGLRRNEKELYKAVQQENFDKINGKLIYNVQNQLQKGPKPTINDQNDIKSYWSYYQKQFKSICKELKNFFDKKQNPQTKIQNQSKITSNFAQLQEWIYPSLLKPVQQFKLLYRASENNFSAAQFHKKCDNINNTLVLIKTQFDKVIGGFNSNKWNQGSAGSYFYDTSNKTFIFSLSLQEKYQNVTGNHSIHYNTTIGPTFGNGNDIYICDRADRDSKSDSCFPTSYNNGHYSKSQQSYQAFSGQTKGHKYSIKQWEVYQVL